MKKFLLMGALALTLAIVSQQQASAWISFKTGACVNLGFQSGGNNWLWGAYRNGQPPGPSAFHAQDFGYDPNAPMPAPPGPRPTSDTTFNHGPTNFQPVNYRAPVYYPMPSYYGYGR